MKHAGGASGSCPSLLRLDRQNRHVDLNTAIALSGRAFASRCRRANATDDHPVLRHAATREVTCHAGRALLSYRAPGAACGRDRWPRAKCARRAASS